MGRRKSKTAKKQQAVTKKLSKAFAKKLGVSTTHRGKDNGGTTPMMITRSNASGKPAKATPIKRSWTKKKTPVRGTAKKQPPSQEASDFAREQAQLHERETVVEWKRNINAKAAGTVAQGLAFQPATFDTKKSVNQLIDETVRQVEGLRGIGGSGTPSAVGGMLGGLSLQQHHYAAEASAWPGAATTTTEESLLSENPWAVLNDCSVNCSENDLQSLTSDNHHGSMQAPPPLTSIAVPVTDGFRPATFQFPGTSSTAATLHSSNNSIATADIDPDL